MKAIYVALAALMISLTACDSSPDGQRHSWNDCRYYGDCPARFPYHADRRGYYDSYRYDRPYDYYYGDDRYRRGMYRRDHHSAFGAPAPRLNSSYVLPSCPAGTSFDGKHCIIPPGERRRGGKGTLSACPKGMWVSDGRCVGR